MSDYKAALYIRVSTTHQVDKDSLPFQREELSNYVKYALNINDYEIFEDAGYSGKNTDRPKYQEMISRTFSGEFSHIVVWKIDRISRNLKDFTEMYEKLNEHNIIFISKNEQFDTSCAMGEAMLKIILVFAELERKLTGERVFSIMLSRAEKGLWNGATVPIGYKWSEEKKFPVIDDIEALTVTYIYNLYEQLNSTSKVAYQLNDEKVNTKRGGKWTPKTVNDILRNPFYIGTYRYNTKESKTRRWKEKKEWIVVEDNHPGIIKIEQFNRVNEALTNNFRGNSMIQRSNTNIHIFSKIMKCDKCGSSMISSLDNARVNGYRPSRYLCYGTRYTGIKDGCNNFFSDIILLPFVLNYISNLININSIGTFSHSLRDVERILLRGNALSDVSNINTDGLKSVKNTFGSHEYYDDLKSEDYSKQEVELQREIKERQKFEKALERLEDLYLFSESDMSKKDYLFKLRDLTTNLEKINSNISKLKQQDVKVHQSINFLTDATNFLMTMELSKKRNVDYKELLESVEHSVIQKFIRTIISEISVKDKKIQSITFQNGMTHKFMYKELKNQTIKSQGKFLYRDYKDRVINYIKENGSVKRIDVEEYTGLTRFNTTSLLNELINESCVIKEGLSISTKYKILE